jgi:hypothetical protein
MPVDDAELNQQIHRRCRYCGGRNIHFRHCVHVRRVRVVDRGPSRHARPSVSPSGGAMGSD